MYSDSQKYLDSPIKRMYFACFRPLTAQSRIIIGSITLLEMLIHIQYFILDGLKCYSIRVYDLFDTVQFQGKFFNFATNSFSVFTFIANIENIIQIHLMQYRLFRCAKLASFFIILRSWLKRRQNTFVVLYSSTVSIHLTTNL